MTECHEGSMRVKNLVRIWVFVLVVQMQPIRAEPELRHSFTDVPRSHPAYAAVERLERHGVFTGFPPEWHMRAVTRYEFGVATQRILSEARRKPYFSGGTDEARLRRAAAQKLGFFRTPAVQLESVRELAREFRAELVLLGVEQDELRAILEPGRQPDADGGKVTLDVPPRRERESAARRRGAVEAHKEWKRGTVTLYGYRGPSTESTLDPVLGVPYKGIAGCVVGGEGIDRAAGHNEEVYRLCLERGLPPNSLQPWVDHILQPKWLWVDPKSAPVRLDLANARAISPDARVEVRLTRGEPMQAPTLRVEADGGATDVYLAGLLASAPRVEVLWGPPDAGLLFLRYTTDAGSLAHYRHVVVRLKKGEVFTR